MSKPTNETIVPIEEVRRFLVASLRREGATVGAAAELADVLVAADMRGHFSHGLNRLDMYIGDFRQGLVNPNGEPKIISEKGATAWVDGANALGPTVANFATAIAVRKAKETGIGWVVAKNSNHFGIAGYYPLKMMEQGLLGMAFTNTSPVVFPTRAARCALGTNPISLAAPGQGSDSFVLDMATSTVALGKAEMAGRKGEEMPAGWGVDSNGRETRDPHDVVLGGAGGGLCPLGGSEISGGYKGYGLAMMVEIFCGILGGANYGTKLHTWQGEESPANLGQCFIAIDPEAFAPGFKPRMQDLINMMRGLPKVDPDKPVLIAGDPEREHMAKCEALGGIPYHENQISHALETAQQQNIEPMKTL